MKRSKINQFIIFISMLIHLIYVVLNILIIFNDFFDVSLQHQIFHLLLWITIGVQVYKYTLQWVLQDKEKAESVFMENIQKLTSLSKLPETLLRQYIMPQLIDAITLKNIQHTVAFFIALNLGISYLSLFLTNKAVRSISLHLLYGLYYHYNKNQQPYQFWIQRIKKIISEKYDALISKIQKQKV
ncbi:unnamed protein product (macronuclear) [Paramecium tetraurelia]|uniref:Uncharacterized protein n=1 Tax=Paramecium tetraurelia TaxID=5888 RepID=A0CNH6_PARTE|nr:uncharacterized protein GSPATT00008785001 [Paramecium tetraurelia]CAK72343.1 unnamed protein product [Paramecium tetraurelia]|eukprot:XP_001439740.1 hypothetical protein (macronuclear) [Paramecium tetraurelia strain d4-2]